MEEILMKDKKQEYLEATNNRIYEQLSYAEAKNGVLVGLLGAVILALLGLAFDEKTGKIADIILYIFSGMLGLSLSISLMSFFPNTDPLGKKPNLYFWGNIAAFSNEEEYLKSFEDKKDELEDQLARQNIQVARIIRRKHMLFSLSLKIIAIAIFPPLIIYFLIKGILGK